MANLITWSCFHSVSVI